MAHQEFTLDHLNDTEFEEYCYDLMRLMGYANVDWRKGTGLNASPSDGGRDIVCDYKSLDPDGDERIEHWFVQCKHYKKGIPPSKISDAIAWAEAEQPEVLLLVASNFFSNPAKDYIKTYIRNNKPKFRIKLWEKPNLEQNSQGHTWLLHKYKLADSLDYLNIMHPAHLDYLKSTHMNELDDFFGLMDKLTEDEQMRVSGIIWGLLLKPRYRKAITGKETIGELMIDPVNYELFKKKCYEIVEDGILPSFLLTSFLVNFILQDTFYHGDTTSIPRYKARMKRYMEISLEEFEGRGEQSRIRFQDFIDRADESFNEAHKVYVRFCDEVVAKLLLMPNGSVE